MCAVTHCEKFRQKRHSASIRPGLHLHRKGSSRSPKNCSREPFEIVVSRETGDSPLCDSLLAFNFEIQIDALQSLNDPKRGFWSPCRRPEAFPTNKLEQFKLNSRENVSKYSERFKGPLQKSVQLSIIDRPIDGVERQATRPVKQVPNRTDPVWCAVCTKRSTQDFKWLQTRYSCLIDFRICFAEIGRLGPPADCSSCDRALHKFHLFERIQWEFRIALSRPNSSHFKVAWAVRIQ